MRVLHHSLWVLLLILISCSQSREMVRHKAAEKSTLWLPCTADQAIFLERQFEQNPEVALQTARCYALLTREGKTRSARLENAVKGRKMAEAAVDHDPENAFAHYLVAYLAGLEAENNTLKGLSLVPVIEHGAMEASRLDPRLDHGGPDRMLGELYLRAPDPPVSIGDLEKAIHHYRRAVSEDPDFTENRLGLAEAYLEDENWGAACRQLQQAVACMSPASIRETEWRRTMVLMKRLCELEMQQD